MNKNLTLFIWFIKFGLVTARDEYNIHDHIKERFCPEYIQADEFDEKEQLLRDTPGPAGIKYAYYVGSKVGGIAGAVIAITALLIPVIAASVILYFAYNPIFYTDAAVISIPVVHGMQAATLGLIASHLYKVVYFNKTNRKSLLIIVPSALLFIFLPNITGLNNAVLTPFYIAAIIVLGTALGFVHDFAAKRAASRPPKYIDPYSKKSIKMRDRLIREDEEALRKDRDDKTLELRRKQILEEEEEKRRKQRGE